jgi:hypothetical protein
MRLPNAIIVGGQKCGSTWLLENLRKHPEVFGPREEVHFFDKDYNYSKGKEWYAAHFEGAEPGHKIVLEKTPDYLFNGETCEGHMPNTANRIYEMLPECKILIILRNPAVRAVSAVQHIIRSGRIPPEIPLKDILLGEKEHLIKEHGVIEYGFYTEDVQRYMELFGKENVHLMIFEEVNKDRELALKEVFQFLGVEVNAEISNKNDKVNAPSASRFLLALKYYLPVLTKFSLLKKLKFLFKGSSSLREKDDALVEELLPMYENDIRLLMNMTGRKILWGIKEE